MDNNREATGTHFNLPGHSKSDMKVWWKKYTPRRSGLEKRENPCTSEKVIHIMRASTENPS